MDCDDQFDEQFFSGGGQWNGGGGWGGFRRGIDEETLMGIAEMTGGDYYSATSAGELHDVFKQLPTNLITKDESMEISVMFAMVGLMFAGLAILLSMVWHPLP
jgi:Ca-activated chloride channel family protein